MAWGLLEGSLQPRRQAKAEGKLAATGLSAEGSGSGGVAPLDARQPGSQSRLAAAAAFNDASGQWDMATEALIMDEGEAEGQASLPTRRLPGRQGQGNSGALSEPGRATQQIRANVELQALVRWYANMQRAAARGELKQERVQQLQERGGLGSLEQQPPR